MRELGMQNTHNNKSRYCLIFQTFYFLGRDKLLFIFFHTLLGTYFELGSRNYSSDLIINFSKSHLKIVFLFSKTHSEHQNSSKVLIRAFS